MTFERFGSIFSFEKTDTYVPTRKMIMKVMKCLEDYEENS